MIKKKKKRKENSTFCDAPWWVVVLSGFDMSSWSSRACPGRPPRGRRGQQIVVPDLTGCG
jgi:pimeloyl-ACP methyl ester carboxylesterase